MIIRVGNGFDIHRFVADGDPPRTLVLGGVTFDGHRGLVGHSDADVITHVCAEALLGASGLGDLGSHFPDTDPTWAGVSSLEILRHVTDVVRTAGWDITNIDVSVIAETPKLAPARDEMERILSEIAGCSVTIKGRRAEQLGALGRQEGIAAFATTCITRRQ